AVAPSHGVRPRQSKAAGRRTRNNLPLKMLHHITCKMPFVAWSGIGRSDRRAQALRQKARETRRSTRYKLAGMSDVTRILGAIERGDPQAAAQLLPLVYDELRKLAAQKLAHEKPGQTLQATALVHEAYLRLTNEPAATDFEGRNHFFAAAAEAMRRILVEKA